VKLLETLKFLFGCTEWEPKMLPMGERESDQPRRMTSFGTPSILLASLLALLFSGTTSSDVRTKSAELSPIPAVSGTSATPILEVINRHFTVGLEIPSIYLKVFSDRTAEGHTLAYSGQERDVVKKKTLAPDEFERLTAVLDAPELLMVKSRYESTRMIIDSWMEWDINIQRPGHAQKIEVVNFSPSWFGMAQPYPDALLQLGCSVWKMRDHVYGAEPGHDDPKCKKALEPH
jgi:hypothetical protein